MERILFIAPAAIGHINSMLAFAGVLANGEYDVTFALPSLAHKYVTARGFKCVALEGFPFGLNEVDRFNESNKPYRVKILDSIADRFYNVTYKQRMKSVSECIAQVKPRIVLLDAFQSSDFIVLYPHLKKHGIKLAFVQTMLSLRQQPKTPPLCTGAVVTGIKTAQYLWLIYYWKRNLRYMWSFLLHAGITNERLLEKKYKDNGVNPFYSINRKQVFRVGFNNLPEFIMFPQSLEFTKHKDHNQHYLGSMPEFHDPDKHDSEFISFLNGLNPLHRIIYCSLGTVYTISKKKRVVIRHFRVLCQVASICDNLEFIVSLDDKTLEQLRDLQIPPNFHIFPYVPQCAVLERSAVFITHGGGQSVKESINHGVPMLVYPIWWDQPGNAARVAYHGLGLRGRLGKDSSRDMEPKLMKLINDRSYSERVNQFKSKQGTPDPCQALEIFNTVLANQIII